MALSRIQPKLKVCTQKLRVLTVYEKAGRETFVPTFFCQTFFCQKNTNTNCKCIKPAQNSSVQKSCSHNVGEIKLTPEHFAP